MRLAVGFVTALVVTALGGVAAAQVDEAYTAAIRDFAVRMAALSTQAVEVNEAWEARDVSFADTSDAFASIATEAGSIFDDVQLLTPPDELAPQHEAMVSAAEQAAAAARAMIDGLNDPNDATSRRTATDQFIAVASEFVSLAELTTAPPTTTTTTAPPTTTSTTTTTVAVATTSPPVTAALPAATEPAVAQSDGGGGAETPLLVLIGLLAGLLVGLTGGLVVGRRARRELIDALQQARAGGAPPE